jgi:glycolate oxidase FAD binding subunit
MTDVAFRPPRQPLVPPGGADLHTRDMTATFAADVTLGAAQDQLRRHNQWLPIDGDEDATLGHLVETNSTGPLRLGYGAWRDLLLGVQFTNGRGELITAGGRTVKNVAGYDLTKFMVGGRGVFGKLVSVTARTYRRPAEAMLARFAPDVKVVNQFMPTPLRPQWIVLTADALLCGYLGDETGVAYYRDRLHAASPREVTRRDLGEDVRHRAELWKADGERTFRAAVLPARLPEFVKALAGSHWIADAAFGVVIGGLESEAAGRSIRDAASGVGGTVQIFARGRRVREAHTASPGEFDISTNPVERRIIDRLKHAFDPDNRLTPLPWHNR